MSSDRDADVIVVGAAVAGSALANAFGQMGVRTLLLEKGPERDNSTRGDILHAPTLNILDRWGVLAALHEDGAIQFEYQAVSHRERGRLATYPIPARGAGMAARSIAVPHDRIEAVIRVRAERWPSVRLESATVAGIRRDGDGRVTGVQARVGDREVAFQAPLVVGCDGTHSIVRRALGISAEHYTYSHDFVHVAAQGPTDPPNAMHWHLDDRGIVMTATRPRGWMRIITSFAQGSRGDLLHRPDPALRDYLVQRVPVLEGAYISKNNVHVYRVIRQIAERFYAPGAAIVGDSAHTTHPMASAGMSLAVSSAARLAESVGPILLDGVAGQASAAALDAALKAYGDERRAGSAQAIQSNHERAILFFETDLYKNPDAFTGIIDPTKGWGPGNAGWGENPAALPQSELARRSAS